EEVAAASAPAAEDAPGRARVSRRLADGRHLEGLDGLVIATSTASHPGLVREAVAAGVPLLVEKPLALELEEQDALVAELEASPVPIMMAYHRRYDPAYRDLRERVRTGEMGRIRLVHAVSHDHHHVTADYIGPSGGIWRDLVIHDLDTVPWLLGEEVEAVYATGTAIDEPAYAEHGDLDTATAILSFRSGAQAVISAARNIAAGHDVRTEVYGSDGAYATGLDGLTPVVSTEPGTQPPAQTHEEFTDRFARAFRAEADHFVSMLRGEAESLTPPAQCAGALRLALAAEESVRTGAPVRG
ncbi:Gfo/Idh/MocA family oxidoreductase, partial [Rothia sp. AR01]